MSPQLSVIPEAAGERVAEDRAVPAEAAPAARTPAGVWTRHLESRLARAERRNAAWGRWFERLRASPLYRLLVASGLWRRGETEALELSRPDAVDWRQFPPPQAHGRLEFPRSNRPSRGGAVAVDLSSLLPGAENGGAKTVALAVVEGLSRARPQEQLLVLVGDDCRRELAGLDWDNVELVTMPAKVDRTFERLVDERAVKVLLCPMTMSSWHDPRVPLVSVVHDLQHRFLPWFFDDAERDRRQRALERVASEADEVISVSASTRRHLLRSVRHPGGEPMPAERITVIHNRLRRRLPALDDDEVRRELDRLGLEAGSFALYPANFWPHKNHQTLLHGFSLFRASHRESRLRLVLTGAQRPDPAPVLEAVRRLGLEGWVRYLGFVDERQLAALYRGGRALVFPSLFEGFGMPLLEAMSHGLPVFASRLGAHQEVAAAAAEYFEPRSPDAIRSMFRRIDADHGLLDRLRRRGPRQAQRVESGGDIGEDYWRVLDRAASRPHRGAEVHGRYPDGWTAERFVITHAAACELVLELCNPKAWPITVELRAGARAREAVVPVGKAVRLHCDLAADGGWIEGRVTPSLRPSEAEGVDDPRRLGVMMRRCFQCSDDGVVLDLLAEAAPCRRRRSHDGQPPRPG